MEYTLYQGELIISSELPSLKVYQFPIKTYKKEIL